MKQRTLKIFCENSKRIKVKVKCFNAHVFCFCHINFNLNNMSRHFYCFCCVINNLNMLCKIISMKKYPRRINQKKKKMFEKYHFDNKHFFARGSQKY